MQARLIMLALFKPKKNGREFLEIVTEKKSNANFLDQEEKRITKIIVNDISYPITDEGQSLFSQTLLHCLELTNNNSKNPLKSSKEKSEIPLDRTIFWTLNVCGEPFLKIASKWSKDNNKLETFLLMKDKQKSNFTLYKKN